MAWVDMKFYLEIGIIDNGENQGTWRVQLTAADYVTAVVDALIVVGYFEAVCAAGTVYYTISQKYVNDALTVPASSAVQKEAKALLVMRDSADPTKKHVSRIPAPEADVFLATSGDGANIVDIAHADVLDYAGMFDDSGGECYLSDGESIATGGLIKGSRVTHRSRRG